LEEFQNENLDARKWWLSYSPVSMGRVGKHAAGRILDGLEHNALPAYLPANVGFAQPRRESVVAELAVIE